MKLTKSFLAFGLLSLLTAGCATTGSSANRETAAASVTAKPVKTNTNPGCGCPSTNPVFYNGQCYDTRANACSGIDICKTYTCK